MWRSVTEFSTNYFFCFILQAGVSQNTLMHLAIFHVFPLQIVGILEINKKVLRLVCSFIKKNVSVEGIQMYVVLTGIWKRCY